jgi:hypothetical protein
MSFVSICLYDTEVLLDYQNFFGAELIAICLKVLSKLVLVKKVLVEGLSVDYLVGELVLTAAGGTVAIAFAFTLAFASPSPSPWP